MSISGRGVLDEDAKRIKDVLGTIKEVEDSVRLRDLCASLPSPDERVGLGVEYELNAGVSGDARTAGRPMEPSGMGDRQ